MAFEFQRQLYKYRLAAGQSATFELPRADDDTGATYSMPNLPAGLTFGSGTISGIPTESQISYYSYIANKSSDTATTVIQLEIHPTIEGRDEFHNCLFFDYPINYKANQVNGLIERNKDGSEIIEAIADNDYNTKISTSANKTITFITSVQGNDPVGNDDETHITHVFVKSKNLASFGIGSETKTIQNSVTNYEGRTVKINTDGFQNCLYKLDQPLLVTQLNIIFTPKSGETAELYEVMILNEKLSLNSNRRFTEISYKLSDRSSIIKKDLAERLTKVPGVNQDRWKWEIAYDSQFHSYDVYPNVDKEGYETPYNQLINFIKDRKNNNFVIAGEYTRYPERVYPATFPNPDMQMAFISQSKSSGESLQFTCLEL